jgi:hypothetical protein
MPRCQDCQGSMYVYIYCRFCYSRLAKYGNTTRPRPHEYIDSILITYWMYVYPRICCRCTYVDSVSEDTRPMYLPFLWQIETRLLKADHTQPPINLILARKLIFPNFSMRTIFAWPWKNVNLPPTASCHVRCFRWRVTP